MPEILRMPEVAASLTEAAPIFVRSSGVMSGEGHSSTTFWLRRWMEQSRSPR